MSAIPIMKPWMGPEEVAAAGAAIESGWVAQGPRVASFERAVADAVGAAEGIAVSSCTTGLHLALAVLGIGRGDEVIVPSLSFIATTNVVMHAGALPVFADVDPLTQNLTADTIKTVITDATRAVILVHQGGMPADVAAVRDLCDPLGIAVIEDAACAIGSEIGGAQIGSHSPFVAFSFHPRKVITTGEGGMVMTQDPAIARRLRLLREHGMSVSAADRDASQSLVLEEYLEVGFNYRMTDIQAAVGLVQLERLPAIVERRRSLAARYHEGLADVAGITVPADPPYGRTNYQSYWIVLADDFPVGRNALLEKMLAQGISPRRGIMAAHLEPPYRDHPRVDLPVTERLTRQSLLLPLFHEMTDDQQDRVVDVVRAAAGTD